MENLCNDVLENILFRLPLGTDSSQAKHVCKTWKTILTNRSHNQVGFLLGFGRTDYSHRRTKSKLHLYFGQEYDHIDIGNKIMMNNYYSEETLMEMEHCRFTFNFSPCHGILVGSCNGLVCFQKKVLDDSSDWHEPFAVCNPLTGEFIFLKPSRARDRHSPVVNGFGYCHSTNEYKVVRLYNLGGKESTGAYVQVYTIGSNKWRDMETYIDHTFSASGIFSNGVLHWLDDADIDDTAIVTFDLEDEKFRELPLPPREAYDQQHGHDETWNQLGLLGGNLCWIKRNDSRINIWAYKKNNLKTNDNNTRCRMDRHDQKHDYYCKNSWNWVREFNIEGGRYYEPFAITKTNQVLLLCSTTFYCYDPKTGTKSQLCEGSIATTFYCSCIIVIPHANTYVSLKDSGETWYGPGCSEVSRTNTYGSMLKVDEAYSNLNLK